MRSDSNTGRCRVGIPETLVANIAYNVTVLNDNGLSSDRDVQLTVPAQGC